MKKADGVQRAQLFADRFEAIAEAAVTAMFKVDGRIDPTPTAKVAENGYEIVPTRKFLAQLRRELKARNFDIWAKHQRWK